MWNLNAHGHGVWCFYVSNEWDQGLRQMNARLKSYASFKEQCWQFNIFHLKCRHSGPAWSHKHGCHIKKKGGITWQHPQVSAKYYRSNRMYVKQENTKQSEGTDIEPIGEGSSVLWPDNDKKITSVAPGCYWNRYLIKGLDTVHEGTLNLSTSAFSVAAMWLFIWV